MAITSVVVIVTISSQKPDKAALHCGLVSQLALPDCEDFPTHTGELPAVFPVPLTIAGYLIGPECDPRFRYSA